MFVPMRNIAVVEDNPDNRLLLQVLLGDRYAITEYETGVLALEGFEASVPELVLLDISLPGMDGTEVLRRMKEEPDLASIPVIAVTAHAMSGDRERFLALGFDAYITKPIVDDQILFDAIEAWLPPQD
ncbi:MAG: response regulator [Gemmatimonadales bacterium]|nr:MAG: response regulator [Gemmatimonadales bacterium]